VTSNFEKLLPKHLLGLFICCSTPCRRQAPDFAT